ncbi:MAG: hypothetical protein AAF664_01595 [Planctomycetota bacterium]
MANMYGTASAIIACYTRTEASPKLSLRQDWTNKKEDDPEYDATDTRYDFQPSKEDGL